MDVLDAHLANLSAGGCGLEVQIQEAAHLEVGDAIEFLIHVVRRKLGITAIRNVRGVGWMVERAL